MPKIKQAKLPNKPGKNISKIQNWYKSLGKIGKLSLALALVITLLFGVNQALIYKEKTMYKNAEKQIATFVDEAAKLAPSTKETRKYCRYSSAKFSNGSLSCTMSTTIKYLPTSENDTKGIIMGADNAQAVIKWRFLGDNTQSNKKYISENYIKSRIYETESIRCGVHYRYDEDKDHNRVSIDGKVVLTIEISCSGPALREYY
ncbi:hypothetical protein IPL85_01905 [Candidatus Saccharibacteria bacterium]|nr:MAG: hypothetical protein IPL85_01905 [Candidatus Saccharibacteria bacterium]